MSRIVTIGDTFSKVLRLAAQDIRLFAEHIGDMNPLHHDEEHARRAGFAGPIASGSHPTAHFLAAATTHFTTFAQPLLLEFNVQVKKPAVSGDLLTMTWTVVDAFWKNTLNGDLTTLEGVVINQREQITLNATAKILVKPKSGDLSTGEGSP
ncbi:MaoC family dehydratase [Robbsia sp. Bb-Pol-6]|uniref:MaoC family dehydratase n=1 Tax=Robbsia betulipollinis TaxID=2981849 RepID=A0ABT3ZR86_9BURK|nr:MaoC family dehydratase [Robbsia betulipollinis]MCY0389064.1 MaoC family dehydratase [Robbsia betulipollinis]